MFAAPTSAATVGDALDHSLSDARGGVVRCRHDAAGDELTRDAVDGDGLRERATDVDANAQSHV